MIPLVTTECFLGKDQTGFSLYSLSQQAIFTKQFLENIQSSHQSPWQGKITLDYRMKLPIAQIAGGINATCFSAILIDQGLFIIAPIQNDGIIEVGWIPSENISKVKKRLDYKV